MPPLRLPSPLTELHDPALEAAGVRLWLKRDDLIHPDLSGNKWRKLKYNLEAARDEGHTRLLTFGGAYSHHLRATAAAGRRFGFETVGIVRGEEHLPLNPSLARAVELGMRLAYLDRAAYRRKTEPETVDRLRAEWGPFFLLPEGGSNEHAVRGCAELPAEITIPFDVLCSPVGTGGTLAGLARGLPPGRRALGFPVLKGAEYLSGEVARLYGAPDGPWELDHAFHCGGYARRSAELDAFLDTFAARHGLRLERVYVAKMLLGLFTRIRAGAFAPGTRIVAVVTGSAPAEEVSHRP
ncbi:pyridoxal-phosphate dependent enzyme [Actinocorallia lasiicapitis]